VYTEACREVDSMRNVTLSADDQLIERARKKAALEHTTLNERFRRWLEQYVGQTSAGDFRQLMKELKHVKAGRSFTRDDANER
jgi:hypothetical protein